MRSSDRARRRVRLERVASRRFDSIRRAIRRRAMRAARVDGAIARASTTRARARRAAEARVAAMRADDRGVDRDGARGARRTRTDSRDRRPTSTSRDRSETYDARVDGDATRGGDPRRAATPRATTTRRRRRCGPGLRYREYADGRRGRGSRRARARASISRSRCTDCRRGRTLSSRAAGRRSLVYGRGYGYEGWDDVGRFRDGDAGGDAACRARSRRAWWACARAGYGEFSCRPSWDGWTTGCFRSRIRSRRGGGC